MLRSIGAGEALSGIAIPVEADFSVEDYLATRAVSENLRVVEFGHSLNPVSLLRTFSKKEGEKITVRNADFWTGGRQYTGVENWMRGSQDIYGRTLKEGFATELENIDFSGLNISFVEQPLQGELREDPDSRLGVVADFRFYYVGEYATRTSLQDGVGDEIIAGNIFNDPLISCYEKERKLKLLAELARVRSEKGVIVLRETITPRHFSLKEEDLSAAGLRVLARIDRRDTSLEDFQKLERVYSAHPGYDSEQGFYLFLGS